MARYFQPITVADLKEKVIKAFDGNFQVMLDKLSNDIKVQFDLENINSSSTKLIGCHTLPNGLTFLGCSAGGDWEHPVFFIVYWDGKKIRGYVPTEGNPWNTTTKEAYGNNEDADEKNAQKRWPDDPYDGDFSIYQNDAKIKQDIMARILPMPAGLKPKKPVKKKPDLSDKIKALVFYAPGDEASELFEQTCSLCYRMYGFGYTAEAETLYEWAKEQAEASKNFAEQEDRLDDFMNGVWG